MPQIEKYFHHGKKVSVMSMNRGKHRYHCLCYSCSKFVIEELPLTGKDNVLVDRRKNCPIANMVYALCVLENLVLPVWECPQFEEKK